jgi:S1-C subfamily serine protease
MAPVGWLALLSLLLGLLVTAPVHAAPLDDVIQFQKDYRPRTVFIEVYAPGETERRATGSGVLLEGGYVLTSLHTLLDKDNGETVEDIGGLKIEGRVGFSEGVQEARLDYVEAVQQHDLALLQFGQALSADYAYVCPRLKRLQQGERIGLVGFPLEGDLMVDTGLVNGLEPNFIKTTMTATLGHSGAGAFDLNGLLVGILRAELRKNGEGTDIYAVVPISRALNLLAIANGETGGVGCEGRDVVADKARDVQKEEQILGLSLPSEATAPVTEALSLGSLEAAEEELAALEEQRRAMDANFRQDAKRLMRSLLDDGYTFGGVLDRKNRWTKSTLRMCFFDGTPEARSVVANIASQWTYYGKLDFDFGSMSSPRSCDPATPSDVRISVESIQNYSFIGNASASAPQANPSMRLARRGTTDFTTYAVTVLHEFGHMLGLKHTQAHPEFCRDELNLDLIYEEMGKQGWNRYTIERNILAAPLPSNEIGSFDANSVMNYKLPARYYKLGEASPCFAREITGLSPLDKLAMYHMYPFDD